MFSYLPVRAILFAFVTIAGMVGATSYVIAQCEALKAQVGVHR